MTYTNDIFASLEQRYSNQTEYLQAVKEVFDSISDEVEAWAELRSHSVLEKLTTPDRVITFRVDWEDDNQNIHSNVGYRVQFNDALGPYKGGLRFDPTVNEGILKFLAFEQIFKNSLTGLWLGGAKGGSDFSPKGKSSKEVRRFSRAFISKLADSIGLDKDVPAGDIGVSSREIGYMAGMLKELNIRFPSALTGKPVEWGGSRLRNEATGYGVIFFTEEVLAHKKSDLVGKRILLSGSGNVALHAAELAIKKKAKVITLSDSGGTVHIPEGLTESQLSFIKVLKLENNGRISEFADEYNLEYLQDSKPWDIEADLALPCATQNEIIEQDAKSISENNLLAVVEGSNMSTTPEAIEVLKQGGVVYVPGKASNAGGVTVSAFEMTQNASLERWSEKKVLDSLSSVMSTIHRQIVDEFQDDYVKGANVIGFRRVANAMLEQA